MVQQKLNSKFFSGRHAGCHLGAFKCEICKIRFTKNALIHHNKLHHSNKRCTDPVTQATPNNVPKQVKIVVIVYCLEHYFLSLQQENLQNRKEKLPKTEAEASADEALRRCKICKKKFHSHSHRSNETFNVNFEVNRSINRLVFLLQDNIKPSTKVNTNANTVNCHTYYDI